jgi:hypothetical protein
MSTLHIVPDTQGNWKVIDDDTGVPLSRHETASSAERAARSLASAADAEAIFIHDRYFRTHRLSAGDRGSHAIGGAPRGRRSPPS